MSEPSQRYDAFLSYSQQDHGTVAWLRGVLGNYWVPGKRRRSVFLDRKSMGAGVLTEEIVEALRDSRFLVVCCSASARDSKWVDREVETFLETHDDRHVLVCAVGPTDALVFPSSIEALQRRRGTLRWPDLRGFPETKPKPEQTPAKEEALSLLAEILGFAGKDALVDSVARGRALRLRLAAGAFASIAIAAIAVWAWLNHSADGALYLARTRVLRAADTEVHDDPYLATTAHALGVMGRRRDVERFAATVKDRDFRGLVLAAGYAALPIPDCEAARSALREFDRSSAPLGLRSLLLVERSCGDSWQDQARPDPLTGDALLRWGRALAETGHGEAARGLLARPDFPAKDRLPLAVAISIGSGTSLMLDESDLAGWGANRSPSDLLYDALNELERLDLGGRLKDPGALRLLERATETLADGHGIWNHRQQLAAHLAGAGETTAENLLGVTPAHALDSPSDAPGLAWRALALYRLGRPGDGSVTFDQAEKAGRTLTPQSRSWREWFDIATAAALAGDWRRACRAAESPGNESTRFALRCHVLELRAHRDRPRSRW
ncbi:MAG: toll/interleukin-1 receptor domain-containing protein [Verrucomicrobiales bacterium]|nr:toll/interleukin-1 receptor domain-containing protein [Verrucomicrobiales bacterium]